MTYCAKADAQHYKDHFEVGIYVCSKCDQELFHAKSKYEHSSAWPAFTQTIRPDSLRKEAEMEQQSSSDKPAMKLFCSKCDNKVGHEFLGDGPDGVSRF